MVVVLWWWRCGASWCVVVRRGASWCVVVSAVVLDAGSQMCLSTLGRSIMQTNLNTA